MYPWQRHCTLAASIIGRPYTQQENKTTKRVQRLCPPHASPMPTTSPLLLLLLQSASLAQPSFIRLHSNMQHVRHELKQPLLLYNSLKCVRQLLLTRFAATAARCAAAAAATVVQRTECIHASTCTYVTNISRNNLQHHTTHTTHNKNGVR